MLDSALKYEKTFASLQLVDRNFKYYPTMMNGGDENLAVILTLILLRFHSLAQLLLQEKENFFNSSGGDQFEGDLDSIVSI